MKRADKPVANPLVVLREEFDDWAVLFDPDTGNAFGLNPMSVFIWKLLDGEHSPKDIMAKIRMECQDAPDDAGTYVEAFIEQLIEKGMAGYEFGNG
jgi:SynChlorMet cassette protein ScmD